MTRLINPRHIGGGRDPLGETMKLRRMIEDLARRIEALEAKPASSAPTRRGPGRPPRGD